MTELLVYVTEPRVNSARTLLAQACAATGSTIRLEVFGTGALYQRLGHRPVPPPPDLVWWFGPFAARAAASDGYVQSLQTLEFSLIGVAGSSSVNRWSDLSGVPRLAVADPERSEIGLALLLATLDHARQVEGDVERGWAWWQERARAGLVLAEDDAGALELVQSGTASHALTLAGGSAIPELPPIPHAIGLAANSRNVDAAKRLLDWLISRAAAAPAPELDIDWCTQQYVATRQRWAQNGFAPTQ